MNELIIILYSFSVLLLQDFLFFFFQFCRSGRSMVFYRKTVGVCLIADAIAGVGGLLGTVVVTLSIC